MKIRKLISKQTIQNRVSELAAKISKDYQNKNVLVVAVLNGSFVFCADLIRQFNFNFATDFVRVSSYKGIKSSGKFKVLSKLKENPKNRHLLIIEDIVDTGSTLDFLNSFFKKHKPLSIKVCCLLNKTFYRKTSAKPHYSGFVLKGDDFVVGYGLDHNGYHRGLPYIGALVLTKPK
ncbi:MAG: hypoxanthine phosphoribosyltransferase [Elusimicrobia bacterium]|nr:hypoxanthine phosphoribosyltransferase [Elusimicrobiota bacterium]